MILIETGHHQVNADRDPDLGSNGVLAGAIERFDSKVLLDPFEEKFDLPAPLVDGGDGQRLEPKVICQKSQALVGITVKITDATESIGVIPFTFVGAQFNDLIASNSGRFINAAGLAGCKASVGFTAYYEERICRMQPEQSVEVEVSSIKNIDTSCLKYHAVQEVDVMNRSIGDADEYRNLALNVDLSMQLNCGLRPSERRPWKHGETQVNGRSVYGVNHLVDVQAVGVASMQSTRLTYENLGDCLIDSPIPKFICVSEICSRHIASDSHRVKVIAAAQARFNVPQPLAKSDLCKSHRKELIASSHTTALARHRVSGNASLKLFAVEDIHDLGENKAAFIHEASLNKPKPKASLRSNASHPDSRVTRSRWRC